MAKVVAFTVKVNGLDQVVANSGDLAKAIRGIKDQIATTDFGTEKYKALDKELGKLIEVQKQLRRDTLEQGRASVRAADGASGSYRSMAAELASLRTRFRDLSQEERKTLGPGLIKRADVLDKKLKGLDASLGQYQRNVGNYASGFRDAFRQIGGVDLAAFASVPTAIAAIAVGAVQGAKALFDLNKGIADLQADVAKTSGLSVEQVRSLTETIKQLDTRTPLEELLQIATVAGRLGVQGEEGIGEFTKAVDVLTVALGDDLGGGAEVVTDTVGKLSNVLFGATQDGTKLAENLLFLGNGLNVLSASGAASAGTIADFAGRISSLATPLGVTPGQILGISASLDELGVKAERGGTAVGKVFQRLTQDPEKFTEQLGITSDVLKQAGLQYESFTDFVNADLVGAFRFASERVVTLSESNVDLGQNLKALGLSGAGALEVFLKLGGANERLGVNIDTATKALTNQDSVLQEAQLKNNNLAGSYERLVNDVREFFVSSEVQDFFALLIDGLRLAAKSAGDFLAAFKPLGAAVGEAFAAFQKLALALGLTNKEGKATEAGQSALNLIYRAARIPLDSVIAGVTLLFKAYAGLVSLTTSVINFFRGQNDELAKTASISTKQAESVFNFGKSSQQAGKEAGEAGKFVKKLGEELDKTGKKATETGKKSADAAKQIKEAFAEGSIAALEKTVSDLSSEINKVADEAVQADLLGKLLSAEQALEAAKDLREKIRAGLTGERDLVVPVALEARELDRSAESVTFEQRAADSIVKINKERNKKILAENKLLEQQEKERIARTQEAEKLVFDSLNRAAGLIIEVNQTVTQNRTADIQARYQSEIDAAQGNAEAITEIEARRDEEVRQVQEAAFERQKQLQIAQAAISGAQAIVSTLSAVPGPIDIATLGVARAIQVGFVVATTAAQIAAIASRRFNAARGVRIGDVAQGPSHAGGGIPFMGGEIEGGEFVDGDGLGGLAVINKRSTAAFLPLLRSIAGRRFSGKGSLLSAVNSYNGWGDPLYREGGIIPTKPNTAPLISTAIRAMTPQMQQQGAQMVGFEDAQVLEFAQVVASRTGQAVRAGVAEGVQDSNRRTERELRAGKRLGGKL